MLKRLENIVSGAVAAVMIIGTGVVVGEANVEYKSSFVDTPARVEAPNQLARNFKHELMFDHHLVSGKVIKKGQPIHGNFKETESQFIPYTIETEAGEVYHASSRGQDIFKVGDNVNTLLGWNLDCDCEVLGRIIEAYQIKLKI